MTFLADSPSSPTSLRLLALVAAFASGCFSPNADTPDGARPTGRDAGALDDGSLDPPDAAGRLDAGPTPTMAEYPDALLCDDDDTRCGPAFDPSAPLSDDELTRRLDEGLALFRYRGRRGACAGCHSPDGVELAFVGYPDADLRRRALDHVDAAQADSLVEYVHALRQRHGRTRLLHPDRYRPLQPAYLPLAPRTPGLHPTDPQAQRERDEAFLRELEARELIWVNERVTSLEMAREAWAQMNALDLHTLPIPVPFDLYSEDAHHGQERASIFEWFPGMASSPTAERWNELVDAYLASPDDATLWALYDAIDAHTACDEDLGEADLADFERACDWMRLKWKSLLVQTHMLRHDSIVFPDTFADHAAPPTIPEALHLAIARNPFWEAGDVVRVAPLARSGGAPCDDGAHPCTFLPPVIDATIADVPSHQEARIRQTQLFLQSWLVMGFVRDPALLYEGESFATFVGDYLEAVLLPQYDVMHAFVVAKMSVAKSAAHEWLDHPDFRQGTGRIASVRTFSFKQIRDNFSPPPADDPRREAHERIFANFARVWIFLVEDELRREGTIYDGIEVLRAVRFMRTWLEELEGADDPAIDALVREIEALAATAIEQRSDAHREEYPGTGLQPTGRWAAFDEPFE